MTTSTVSLNGASAEAGATSKTAFGTDGTLSADGTPHTMEVRNVHKTFGSFKVLQGLEGLPRHGGGTGQQHGRTGRVGDRTHPERVGQGIDATNKWPGETSREWGRPLAMPTEVKTRVDAVWQTLGL